MIAELRLGYSGIQSAFEIIKVLNTVATQAQINEVKLELQGHLLTANQALTAAQHADASASEKIRELEQEIVKLKNWEGEKENYELHAVDSGAFAYMEKDTVNSGKPPHWLCANCFENGHRSILQFQARETPKGGGHAIDRWSCSKCDRGFAVHFRVEPRRTPRQVAPA